MPIAKAMFAGLLRIGFRNIHLVIHHQTENFAVGMPTDVAIPIIGSRPVSSKATSCGVLAGYEWLCDVLKFGCCEGNQLLVYIAPTPDGRGAVNSWALGKG